MSRMRPEYLDAEVSDRSIASDVLVREEPNEEEDEESDENEEDDNNEEDGDEGYSE